VCGVIWIDLVDFFFSSRRRHTRSKRDWSSDVCCSDLAIPSGAGGPQQRSGADRPARGKKGTGIVMIVSRFRSLLVCRAAQNPGRSEERRVGVERSWVSGGAEGGRGSSV